MFSNCGAVPWTARRWNQSILEEINPDVHWKDCCWSWSSSALATWCKELTHWKRPWCWERLRSKGEGADRAWDGWMVSLTQWTWIWANSRRQWSSEDPGVLHIAHEVAKSQVWLSSNWTDLKCTLWGDLTNEFTCIKWTMTLLNCHPQKFSCELYVHLKNNSHIKQWRHFGVDFFWLVVNLPHYFWF